MGLQASCKTGPQSGPESGLSLVEVMVAMFILALASTAIVMTMPKQSSELDRETARLETAIARLSDEAIASGETRALRLGDNHYAVEVWRDGAWQALAGKEHTLPGSMSIQALKADTPVTWPHIVADSTGIVVAPGLKLEKGTEQRVLVVSVTGIVQVAR